MARPPLDFGSVFGIAPEVSADGFSALGAHLNQAMARHQLAGSPQPKAQSWLQTASADQIEQATQHLRQQNHENQMRLMDNRRHGR